MPRSLRACGFLIYSPQRRKPGRFDPNRPVKAPQPPVQAGLPEGPKAGGPKSRKRAQGPSGAKERVFGPLDLIWETSGFFGWLLGDTEGVRTGQQFQNLPASFNAEFDQNSGMIAGYFIPVRNDEPEGCTLTISGSTLCGVPTSISGEPNRNGEYCNGNIDHECQKEVRIFPRLFPTLWDLTAEKIRTSLRYLDSQAGCDAVKPIELSVLVPQSIYSIACPATREVS